MEIPSEYLGQLVVVTVDRPMGSLHPEHGFVYEVNYGYIDNAVAPDGEGLDAYLLGVDAPVQSGEGTCIAIIHRVNDADDKLVVSATGEDFTDDDITRLTNFQEQWFQVEIIRSLPDTV
jgi:inorganic pyrophosphatase